MQPDRSNVDVLRGSLLIDCPRMVLKQDATTDALAYRGPGHIRIDGDRIELKLFGVCNKGIGATLAQAAAVNASGLLYAKSDFFTLQARDLDGRLWTSAQIRPSVQRSMQFPRRVVINAQLDEIKRSRRSFKEEHSVTLVIANQDEREWSALIGAWKVGAPYTGYHIAFAMKVGGHLLVEISSTRELPEDLAVRLFEALCFVSGRALKVRIGERVQGNTADTSYMALGPATAMRPAFPPIELRHSANDPAARVLLVRYLQFANTADVRGIWHQCSGHLSHARQASNLSLDAWIVGACVALEGISTMFPHAADPADKKVIKLVRRYAAAAMGKAGIPRHIQKRVEGSLGQLSNVRVVDRLNLLIAAGIIDASYLKAWGDLRNKGVHTSKLSQEDFTDPKLQVAITNVHKVQTLIHQLVFKLIGYSGPYVDYGSPNYPIRTF